MPLLLSVLGLVGVLTGCSSSDEKEHPASTAVTARRLANIEPDEVNLILVTIDTLRADRLSCFGSDVETPNIDRLASEGVLFTNTATTVPFTFPAHSSIMTGTYPPFHGVRENVGYYLGESNTTLAQHLGQSGRETAGFVSAFVLDSRWGIGRGFDHYHDDFELSAFEDANIGSVQRPGSETIAAATAWLEDRGRGGADAKPFFLWLHLFDPHDPYTPPEPFRSQYPGRPYDAEVAYTDSLIGSFVDALEERGLLESSVLILTADHGEGLGDHGETFHGYFVYDSTVHVPMILRLPGASLAGRRVDEAVSHVDIAPTLLELTGQEIPTRMQGRSLLPLLTDVAGGSAEAAPPAQVYTESFYPLLHYGWAPLRALRSEQYKFIESPNPELFDLGVDPDEESNLFLENEKTGRGMARALAELGRSLEEGAATNTETPDLDATTLAQLRALGYVAGPGETEISTYDPSLPRTDPKEKFPLHRTIMLAQGRIGEGRTEEAAAMLQRALEEDPELIDVHQMLGNLELESERPEVAAAHFERALALDDRNQPSLFGLATAHRELGRTDDALLGYRRLLEVAGQDSKATLAIADIEVDSGDLAAAEKTLSEAAQPGAPALIFNRLGEVQTLTENLDAAERSFEVAIESNPRLSEPHFNLAVIAEERGDIPRARREYEVAIELAPKHYQAQFNLARLMGRLGDSDRERELLEKAIESKPDFAMGYFFLGKSLMEADQLVRAEEITRAGLAITDQSQLGWYVLADILNRRGRPDEAERAVDKGKSVAS